MSKSLQVAIENSKQLNNWHPFYIIPKSEISCDNYFNILINCLENNSNKERCIQKYTEMMKCLFNKGLKLSDMYK